jgi:tetratricopeptide (TPR) repeat protein
MILYRFTVSLFTFLWISGFLSLLPAAEMTSQIDLFRQESQKFMIRGVYYLINQNNPDAAEDEFQQAIVLDQHNGEAYYFLGRIYYEQATSTSNLSVSQLQQFIGQSKALLLRAQELGITYDKLHPNLLSRLKREYPKVAPIYEEELFPKKANIIIETEVPTFDIRASKTNQQNTSVIVGTFLPEEEISIEGDTSYQLEFLPKKPKSIKHLILVGIGLTIWLIR